MSFRDSSAEEFATIVTAKASDTFQRNYARFRPSIYEGWDKKPDFQLHDGVLHVAADFKAPALATLVNGDFVVDGLLDLGNPYDRGFDEGGLFIVLGSLRCQSFVGETGKCAFIDGSTTARDFLLTCHEDSGVLIFGDLTARFLLAADTWPYVGGGVSIEYGDGACLSLDGSNQVGSPRHDKAASAQVLGLDDLDDVDAIQLVEDIRAGRVFFGED